MRNMFKKVISLLLAVMMVLSIFTIVPMTASADTTTQVSNTGNVTAKALYKSHKIEWSISGNSADFKIATVTSEGTKVLDEQPTITNVQVGDTYYYTALVPVSVSTPRGTTYAVLKDDVQYENTATIDDITGVAALKKNAVYTFNSETGYTFNSESSKRITITTATGDKQLLFKKLSSLATGSIIGDFAPTTTTGNNNIALVAGTTFQKLWVGFGVSGGAQKYTYDNNSKWNYHGTSNTTTTRRIYGVSMDGAKATLSVEGATLTSFTEIDKTKLLGASETTGYYIGGTGDYSYTSSASNSGQRTSNKFTLYNLIISEEQYSESELNNITKSNIQTELVNVTVKSLYKSHKIEWSSTTISDVNKFIITDTDGNKVDTKNITKVTLNNINYYTALAYVNSGKQSGTKYTVTDGSTPYSATVVTTEATGLDALRKNALLSVNYLDTESNGYKSFSGTNSAVKLNITDLQYQKIKAMTTGTWITSANYKNTTATGAHAILSFGTASGDVETWTGLNGSNFYQRSDKKAKTIADNASVGNHNVVVTFNGTSTLASIDGGNVKTLTNSNIISNDERITKDTFYVGGINGTNNFTFTGDIYYAIFSEEVYNDAEIKLLSQTPYGALQTTIAKAQTYIDNINVKNDANYRKLKSDLATYSTYGTSTSVKDCFKAITILENDILAIAYRTGVETPVAIAKETLKQYTEDNNHAQGSLENGVYKDGDAKQVFDGKAETLWHSNYDDTGKGLNRSVNEENPVWMQTGFNGTKYITKLECTPRSALSNQLKKYAVYVSTSETEPSVDISAENSADWTLVKSGELTACTNTSQKHVISFQPVEAKWVRLVAYTTSSGNLLTIAEMDIYKVDNANIALSRYANEIENKLVEAEQILARENLCINDAYNNLVTICQNYKTYDLAEHDSDKELQELEKNIKDITFSITTDKTAIDKELLKKNADSNSYVNETQDKPAYAAFDNNDNTWWHSYYNKTTAHGSQLSANNPVWIQTGFGNDTNVGVEKTITGISFTPRDKDWQNKTEYKCQLHDYAVYVSNSDTKPNADDATTVENGWKLVIKGAFEYKESNDARTITFEKPVEAKWIRIVAYSALDSASGNSNYVAIKEMDIYEVASCTYEAEIISNDIQNQVNQAKKLILKAGIDAKDLNKQIAELSNYTELLKTCDATQLQEKLTAISQKIKTSGENEKSFNKDTENENSFANDSVKWNNSNDRLQILQNNAKGTKAEGSAISVLFNGNAQISVSEGEYYGTYSEKEGTKTPWIQTGFNETVCLSGIVVYDRYNKANNGNAQDTFDGYEIWVSNDEDFTTYEVAAIGTRTDKTYKTSGYAIKFATPYNCKYVRFNMKNNTEYLKLCEIDIYEYVGKSEEVELVVTSVAENCTDINVADKIGKALTLNRKYSDKFTQDEVNEQLLSQGISLNDLAHNYTISVNDSGNIEVAVNKARYTLDVYNKGSKVYTQTEDYNGVFEKQIEGCTAWRIGDSKTGSIICTGDTFNYRATGDITVYVETSTEAPQISVYIPEPLVSYDNSQTVVEIPVYLIGTRKPQEKGIVFVANSIANNTEAIKNYISGEDTTTNASKILKFESTVGLTNKGRYLHELTYKGKWPTGTFYAYIILDNNVILSNPQEHTKK